MTSRNVCSLFLSSGKVLGLLLEGRDTVLQMEVVSQLMYDAFALLDEGYCNMYFFSHAIPDKLLLYGPLDFGVILLSEPLQVFMQTDYFYDKMGSS